MVFKEKLSKPTQLLNCQVQMLRMIV